MSDLDYEPWRPDSPYWRAQIMPALWTPVQRLWLVECGLAEIAGRGTSMTLRDVETLLCQLPCWLEEIHAARLAIQRREQPDWPEGYPDTNWP